MPIKDSKEILMWRVAESAVNQHGIFLLTNQQRSKHEFRGPSRVARLEFRDVLRQISHSIELVDRSWACVQPTRNSVPRGGGGGGG